MTPLEKFHFMKASTRPLGLFVLLLVATSARAADQDHHYLQAKAVLPQNLLPAPPAVGSEEWKSEIDTLLAIQASRNSAQVARFKAEEKLTLAAFASVMPDFFNSENLPKLENLLNAVADDSKFFTSAAKDRFQRQRPAKEDNRIQPLGKPEDDMSYPSGHATKGILWAMILAKLEPGRSTKLMERGREIGWDRVIGGKHHPSDIMAGRVLGQAIARVLLRNAEFKADLKEAQAEYESVKKSNSGRAAVHSN
jgi:acid phosphatase (class A)